VTNITTFYKMHGNYSSKFLNWCVPCLCSNKHFTLN